MFGRIADAVVTRLLPYVKESVREEIAHQDDTRRREVRELVREMEDVLEKLSLQAARQAKRRSRAAREQIDDEESAAGATALPSPKPAMSKDQVRAQFGHMLFSRPRS